MLKKRIHDHLAAGGRWLKCLLLPSQVCTDEEWSYSISGLFYSDKIWITTVCNIYIKTVLRHSLKVDLNEDCTSDSVTSSAAPVHFTWHMLLAWRVRKLEEAACFSESAITTVYGPDPFCSFSCFSFDWELVLLICSIFELCRFRKML